MDSSSLSQTKCQHNQPYVPERSRVEMSTVSVSRTRPLPAVYIDTFLCLEFHVRSAVKHKQLKYGPIVPARRHTHGLDGGDDSAGPQGHRAITVECIDLHHVRGDKAHEND